MTSHQFVSTSLPMPNADSVISVKDIVVQLGGQTILNGLTLEIKRGEILGFIGPSGSGKSILMRTILGLVPKKSGNINILGVDFDKISKEKKSAIDGCMGVLFQQGALFSSLTVAENIEFPMREYLTISPKLRKELAYVKLGLVGLDRTTAIKYPSELSGGMVKRVALARALALDPQIIFLDEPTSGLDPIGASEFDTLIGDLRDTMGLTVYMVTHDLGSLYSVCDRVAVLGKGKIIAEGTIETMLKSDDPWIQSYFHGERADQSARRSLSHSDFRAEGSSF